ncbi:M16 family metallopeptidase [Adhaeribacter soli]|uniref:Insulinase family protein n=1 Tax=Adhaeribacter soli TaxID=2607655 RepID=A0A5N1IUE4_9BACT|nr:pitrilysin family protein [Adhaeribacter soli]KAA9333825.1 insulinase family protein [Adhaeribacter soli]
MMLDRSIAPSVQEIKDYSLPTAEVIQLSNNVRIHYLENATQPVVRLEIVFPAGKWYEPEKGVSYFTSKLLLEGTSKKSAKQIADILDFYGASLECNQGFDWATLTLYCLSKFYKDLFPLVQEILSEAALPEHELELLKKRTIQNIGVERKKPAYLAMERFTQKVYGLDHPYVSGLQETDIQAVSLGSIKDFFSRSYLLSGTEIFLCGDIKPEIKQLTEAYFGAHENPKNVSHEAKLSHALNPDTNLGDVKVPGSLQAAIRVGKIFPVINSSDYLPLTLVNRILGGYFGSRLMKNIREDKGFTYGIYSSLSVRKYSTLFFIGTDVIGSAAEETVSEIFKEIERLKNELVPEQELATVKNYMIGKFLSETNNIFDQTDRYKHIVLHELPQDHYQLYLQTIRKSTSEEIRDLTRKYFTEDLVTTIAGA